MKFQFAPFAIKKLKLLVFGLLLPATGAYAQIPVTDGAALAQQVQQVMAWGNQLRAMSDQYGQLQSVYQSTTGNRGYGNLLNNPRLASFLPREWQSVYSQVTRGLNGLSPGAASLRKAYGSRYDCSEIRDQEARLACEQQVGKPFQDMDLFSSSLALANQRTDQIQGLIGAIQSTDDPKSIAELQARIAGEQASIQNEMVKMQLAIQLAEVQNKVLEQTRRQNALLRLNKLKKEAFDNLRAGR